MKPSRAAKNGGEDFEECGGIAFVNDRSAFRAALCNRRDRKNAKRGACKLPRQQLGTYSLIISLIEFSNARRVKIRINSR